MGLKHDGSRERRRITWLLALFLDYFVSGELHTSSAS
jgi:hypothetical protein